jgi:hopanoid-associated phosphorylase
VTRLGVVTGMTSEARRLPREVAGSAPLVACSGADSARAAAAARRLIADGAEALLSFGLAGGLDPRLNPGDLIVADMVVDRRRETYETDLAWRVALFQALGVARPSGGAVLGSDILVASAEEKAKLRDSTGAVAVDMESFAVGAVAEQAGVPFAILRAVADPLWRDVPSAARAGIAADGGLRVGAVLAGLIVAPWQLVSLVAIAIETRQSLAALGRAAELAPDLGV